MTSSKKPNIGWKDPLGDALTKMIQKAIRSGARDEAGLRRVVNKAAAQIRHGVKGSAGGRTGRVAASEFAETPRKVISEAVKRQKSLKKDAARIVKQANDKRIIKAQSKTVNAAQLGEAAGRKGSKISKGKEVALSKEKVAKAVSQGRMATSQRAKGNAKLAAEQADSRAQIKAAKTAAERYARREALKKHVAKHGEFK